MPRKNRWHRRNTTLDRGRRPPGQCMLWPHSIPHLYLTYQLHILHSFWLVTETTKSVHTFLKTPGAFGMARAIADSTPEKLEEYMLTSEREGRPVSLQRLQADKDAPASLRQGVNCLHQTTA